jgi:hypothetical protein
MWITLSRLYRQIANVDALKAAAEFTTVRHLAMRFRGLPRSGMVEVLAYRCMQ